MDQKNEKLFANDNVYSNLFVLTEMHGICAGKITVLHCKDMIKSK